MQGISLFSSKVEARLFIIFFICSATPLALLSYAGMQELESQTLSQAEDQLKVRTKTEALNIMSRISGIESQLLHYVSVLPDNVARYAQLIDGVASVEQGGIEEGTQSSLLFEEESAFLTIYPPGQSLTAKLDLAIVWPNYELGSEHSMQCIHINYAPFACHGQQGVERELESISVEWELFLNSAFSSNQVFTMHGQIDKRAALKPIELVAEIVPFIVAVMCLLLAFFSIRILRYRLMPLKMLKNATQRLQAGDFRTPERIQSGDEFETLGDAFTKMTQRLGESFHLMQALSKVDRLILSSGNFSEVVQEVLNIGQTRNVLSCTFHHDNKDKTTECNFYALSFADGKFQELATGEKTPVMGYQNEFLSYPVFLGEKQFGILCIDNQAIAATQNEIDRFTRMADKLSVAINHFQHAKKLYNQANFDSLTGLSNRYSFRDHLGHAIERRRRDGNQGVVIFIDLDRFKQVNDTEGHKAGDRMLRLLTTRISACIRKSDVFARMGGDEFAILLNEFESVIAVGELCERLNEVISEKMTVDHLEHSVSASIGIAIFPDDGKDVDQLLMHADTAMYHAKEQGGSRHCFFDPVLNESTQQRVIMESRLRRAVQEGALDLYFQPQLDLTTGHISGAEALVRWTDKELGVVGPDKFIPVAEETGLIHQIEPILFEKAASVVHALEASQGSHPRIAINVSPKQFSEDFSERVFRLLSHLDLRPESIELEVTESSFISDANMVVEQLNNLRSKGIEIALDDFGTGYSSFNMLRTLPIDLIKIDRAFILEITTEERALGLAQHIIQIAKTLGKKVIAEGTESQREIDILRGLGCDYIQGYAFSKPLERSLFLEFVQQHSSEINVQPGSTATQKLPATPRPRLH